VFNDIAYPSFRGSATPPRPPYPIHAGVVNAYASYSDDTKLRFADFPELCLAGRAAFRDITEQTQSRPEPNFYAERDTHSLLARNPPIAPTSELLVAGSCNSNSIHEGRPASADQRSIDSRSPRAVTSAQLRSSDSPQRDVCYATGSDCPRAPVAAQTRMPVPDELRDRRRETHRGCARRQNRAPLAVFM